MAASRLLVHTLNQTKDLVLMTLSDFTDEDMLQRPCGKANHVTWQLGHFSISTYNMVGGVDPKVQAPADKAVMFKKEMSASDDASVFPKKSEMIAMFTDSMDKAAGWAATLSDAEIEKPGPEPMRQFAPTIGDIPVAISLHAAMHLGQFQVIRRALGKPLLF